MTKNMEKYIKPTANSISDVVLQYNKISKTISPLVEQYFKKTYEEWKHFCGWNFSEDGYKIYINYSYEDFYSNTESFTEHDTETIPLENIIELITEK